MRRFLVVGAMAVLSLAAAVGLVASAAEPVPEDCVLYANLSAPPVPSGRWSLRHDTGRIINGQLYYCPLGGPAPKGQPTPWSDPAQVQVMSVLKVPPSDRLG